MCRREITASDLMLAPEANSDKGVKEESAAPERLQLRYE